MVDHIPALPPSPRATQPIQRRSDAGAERGRNAFQQALEQGGQEEPPKDEAGHPNGQQTPGGQEPVHHEPGEPGATLDIVV